MKKQSRRLVSFEVKVYHNENHIFIALTGLVRKKSIHGLYEYPVNHVKEIGYNEIAKKVFYAFKHSFNIIQTTT